MQGVAWWGYVVMLCALGHGVCVCVCVCARARVYVHMCMFLLIMHHFSTVFHAICSVTLTSQLHSTWSVNVWSDIVHCKVAYVCAVYAHCSVGHAIFS